MDADDQVWVVLDGERYQLIRYGSETIDGVATFSTPCHVCGTRPSHRHRHDCPLGAGSFYRRPKWCRDCGTAIGALHVCGCGIEQCPRCGGQYASCGCDSSEDQSSEICDDDSDIDGE